MSILSSSLGHCDELNKVLLRGELVKEVETIVEEAEEAWLETLMELALYVRDATQDQVREEVFREWSERTGEAA